MRNSDNILWEYRSKCSKCKAKLVWSGEFASAFSEYKDNKHDIPVCYECLKSVRMCDCNTN